jgi:peptidoglycan/LPS O-acetylase OafA/YrhL
MSLGEALNGHRNSLGLMRLFFALAVIFSHAFFLGGFGGDPTLGMTNGQTTIGGFAVDGFFAISGYLIAKSGASSDVIQFLWRRALRILPAFWTMLIVTALAIGPIFWVLSGNVLRSYFSRGDGGPWTYVLRDWRLRPGQYGIWDIFGETTPYGLQVHSSVFNGSIWTLEYEWFCYMIIAALCFMAVLTRAKILVPVLTGVFFLLSFTNTLSPGSIGTVVPFLGDAYRLSFPLVFLLGSTVAMYSKKVPFSGWLALGSLAVLLGSLRWGGYKLIGVAALVYLVLWVAAALPKRVQWIGQKNDYSYGVYIYGWPVQQMLAFFGLEKWGYLPYVAITIVGTAILAWLSWHGVEKWAMAIKDWGPGRGVRYWVDRIRGKLAAHRTTPSP